MQEHTCAFCGDPAKGFVVEAPTGVLICVECINILLEIVIQEIVQEQARHSTLN